MLNFETPQLYIYGKWIPLTKHLRNPTLRVVPQHWLLTRDPEKTSIKKKTAKKNIVGEAICRMNSHTCKNLSSWMQR